jgi:hypothetical protein
MMTRSASNAAGSKQICNQDATKLPYYEKRHIASMAGSPGFGILNYAILIACLAAIVRIGCLFAGQKKTTEMTSRRQFREIAGTPYRFRCPTVQFSRFTASRPKLGSLAWRVRSAVLTKFSVEDVREVTTMKAAQILRGKIADNGRVTTGVLCTFHFWPGMVELAIQAGLDHLIIDMEHLTFDTGILVRPWSGTGQQGEVEDFWFPESISVPGRKPALHPFFSFFRRDPLSLILLPLDARLLAVHGNQVEADAVQSADYFCSLASRHVILRNNVATV